MQYCTFTIREPSNDFDHNMMLELWKCSNVKCYRMLEYNMLYESNAQDLSYCSPCDALIVYN